MEGGMMDLVASQEDPYLWEIARIKREGQINALCGQIGNIKHYLANDAWKATEAAGRYRKLGEAITRAERKLKQMRLVLDAIQELDPNND